MIFFQYLGGGDVGLWPRLCENPKLEFSSGNHSIYFLVSELDVGFLFPDKQMDGSFVKCCPKNNNRQIVFTQPGPEPATNDEVS